MRRRVRSIPLYFIASATLAVGINLFFIFYPDNPLGVTVPLQLTTLGLLITAADVAIKSGLDGGADLEDVIVDLKAQVKSGVRETRKIRRLLFALVFISAACLLRREKH